MAWAPTKVDLSGLVEIRRPLRFAECYGTVGGFAVGGTLAGLSLAAVVDEAAPRLYEANQGVLGISWEHHVFPMHREDPRVDVVAATLPYEGVGENHSRVSDVFGYAGRARAAALVLAVPPAMWATQDGRGLISTLRTALERQTVCKYRATYVAVDDLACGGPLADGPQHFVVLSQAPFGVERPDTAWLPTVHDAIGDLETARESWADQVLCQSPTWWSASLRTRHHTVDGCAGPDPYGNMVRVTEPDLPFRGFKPEGIRWAKHPVLDRHLTHREAARLMGFPDAWRLEAARGLGALGALWGTGPTVGAARWLLHWVDRSLHGEPGYETGDGISGPEIGRWTFTLQVNAPEVQAERQWGSDWRTRL